MLLAYYVHDLSPFLLKIGGFGLRWYGLAYLAGFVIGTLLYRRLAQRGYSDLRPDQVADFITMGALFGVLLGGRLGYMLFYDPVGFLHDPLLIIRVWEGGMASHGGILGLALYTFWYARKHGFSWRNLCDNLVVVAPVGLFLGRCANFINGELYGREATFPDMAQERRAGDRVKHLSGESGRSPAGGDDQGNRGGGFRHGCRSQCVPSSTRRIASTTVGTRWSGEQSVTLRP